MPVEILDEVSLPYTHQIRYRHLTPDDSALWDMFIIQYPTEFTQVWYDVRTGTLPEGLADPTTGWIERHVKQSYMKRIDVIGYQAPDWHIIELKPSAGMIALGQIIVYTTCIAEQLPALAKIKGRIITDKADPDMKPIAASHNITVTELTIPLAP